MSLYHGPRDVSEHLEELERQFGHFGYNHHKGPLRGWQAERQLARIREGELKKRRIVPKSKLFAWFLQGILTWARVVRQAS